MMLRIGALLGALLIMASQLAYGVSVMPDEMGTTRRWVAAKFEASQEAPHGQFTPGAPFSFTYGGAASSELLKMWELKREAHRLDDQRTEHTLTWTDPKTGLVVRCVAVEYHDFPTVEWTLYFKNAGKADTPIVADIQAIDTCIERGDYRFEPNGTQGHTYGLSTWVPYYGTGVFNESMYVLRSHFCPCYGIGGDVRRGNTDWVKMRRAMDDWRRIIPYFLGDYYPLTPYSLASDVWMAWQFDSPELGEGVVQAFRRAESPYEAARLKLRELDPEARYTIADLDTRSSMETTGRELGEKGLLVAIRDKPGCALVTYKRVPRTP